LTEPSPPILRAAGITFGFGRGPDFLRSIQLDVAPGQCWGIIGPNGAGKSTLLRLLAGLIAPRSGNVHFDGAPLGEQPLRSRARRIAFLPQGPPRDLPILAREVVLMGRYPHRRLGLFESAADYAIADRAMATTHTTDLADRPLLALSGGEAQRIHIAACLAQEPAVMLLDEPTASLDLYHQLSIFTILRHLTDGGRIAVVVVTHDLNLAARFCTHVLLLDEGVAVASGGPAEVIRPERLEAVYEVRLSVAEAAGGLGRWIVAVEPRRENTAPDRGPR